jgi:hypothetical protein
MARQFDEMLNMWGNLNTRVHGQSAERQPVCNSVKLLHAGEMRCKTLNVALVKELAGLDEVRISLFEFALLHNCLFLVSLSVFGQELLEPGVDLRMRIPEMLPYSLTGGIFEIEEDRTFASLAQPDLFSKTR